MYWVRSPHLGRVMGILEADSPRVVNDRTVEAPAATTIGQRHSILRERRIPGAWSDHGMGSMTPLGSNRRAAMRIWSSCSHCRALKAWSTKA